jgi:hypothetical protein
MAAIFPQARALIRDDGALNYLRRNDGNYAASPWTRVTSLPAIGIALLCMFWGAAVVLAEWNALFVGLAVVACALILVDFRIGAILLIVLMPISQSEIFPHAIAGVTGLNPLNILLMATLGAYLLHALSDRSMARFMPRPLLCLYILPFAIAGVLGSRHVGDIAFYFFATGQLNFTNATGYLRDIVVKPMFLVLFALLVGASVARTRTPEKFLVPTLISMWVMCLLAIVYFVLSGKGLADIAQSTARPFFTPLGLHANELGAMYAIAYALLLFTWAETKDYGFKVILVASMALVVMALILTFSRAAFAGFVMVNGLFLLSRRKAIGLFLGCVIAALVVLFLPDVIYYRLSRGFGGGANAISAGRIDGIWIPLLPDVLKSPVYGSGLWSMLWSDAIRSGRSLLVLHPHSAYLQTVLDMGIAGLVLVGAYFFHVWRRFRGLSVDPDLSGTQRGFYQGAAAALLAFLTMGIVDGSFTPKPEQVFLWLAIGMMYGQCARKAVT